jgi:hypothetical protein
MNIIDATADYESWLERRLPAPPVKRDLKKKHRKMAGDSPFPFLRATFYRWAGRWPKLCGRQRPLAALPGTHEVVAVADLHVENFGTWRDADGRLVWGVNDFDEAHRMPFASDLVRLATSAALAAAEGVLSADPSTAATAVLSGYRQGLEAGRKRQPEWRGKPRPFVIDQANRWLAVLANNRDPAAYWKDLRSDLEELDDPDGKAGVPPAAADLLRGAMPVPPPGMKAIRYYRRQAGMGSLGRPRYVALADWNGWPIAREVKALAPSACVWAHDPNGTAGGPGNPFYADLIAGPYRSGDACVRAAGGWVVRRLAPDCDKLDLPATANVADEERLLRAMGHETANLHAGTKGAAEPVLKDLDRLDKVAPAWLARAAGVMLEDTVKDWERWRAHWMQCGTE